MITQKKLTIPIFDYKLSIIIYDDWEEVKYLDLASKDENNAPAGFTKWKFGSAIVAIQSNKSSSIVHEAEHVKNLIWEYIGYTPQANNDEVDAYLLTYIYNKIVNVYYKHNN